MNSEQEKIQCKETLLDNITGLKAVVNNLEVMVKNSEFLDSYKFDNEMNVINYFIGGIRTNFALFKHANNKYLDELEDMEKVIGND